MARRIGRIIAGLLVVLIGSSFSVPAQSGPEAKTKPPHRDDGTKKGPRRGWALPGQGPEFERMVFLAFSPPEEVKATIDQLPQFENKGPEPREPLLRRLESFRKNLIEQALRAAEEMNVNVPPAEETNFARSYWRQRIEVERKLREETEPRRRELMEGVKSNLQRDFGTK